MGKLGVMLMVIDGTKNNKTLKKRGIILSFLFTGMFELSPLVCTYQHRILLTLLMTLALEFDCICINEDCHK